jgi:putative addiction module killer protein
MVLSMRRVERSPQYDRWIDNLKDRAGKARIIARIVRLEAGNPGDAEHVGEGVWELRIHTGPGYRVYYTQHGDELLLLLVGGDKSTQPKDIELAKEISKAWKLQLEEEKRNENRN